MKVHVQRKISDYTGPWKEFCKKNGHSLDHIFLVETPDIENPEDFCRMDFLIPGFARVMGNTFILVSCYKEELPVPTSAEIMPREAGKKSDTGKPIMAAVPPNALLEVAEVLTFGAKKYGRDNWNQVEDAAIRYLDAALRHINAYQRGELADPESTKHTLAHAVCCLMFIIEKQKGETK